MFPFFAELVENLCLLRVSNARFEVQNGIFCFDRICQTLCVRDCDPEALNPMFVFEVC